MKNPITPSPSVIFTLSVIPDLIGNLESVLVRWIPAFAGMTEKDFCGQSQLVNQVSYKKKYLIERGFTLIELLVVIAIIAILAGAIIVAVNPRKRISEAQDAQRWAEVKGVLTAVNGYLVDNKGMMAPHCGTTELPADDDWRWISDKDGGLEGDYYFCNLAEDLDPYFARFPEDPVTGDLDNTGNSGYLIKRTSTGSVWVWASGKSEYAPSEIQANN